MNTASWMGTRTAVVRAATPAARYSVLQDGVGCGVTRTRSDSWSLVGEEVMRLASLVLASLPSPSVFSGPVHCQESYGPACQGPPSGPAFGGSSPKTDQAANATSSEAVGLASPPRGTRGPTAAPEGTLIGMRFSSGISGCAWTSALTAGP